MAIEIMPEWMVNLEDEDIALIKRLAVNEKSTLRRPRYCWLSIKKS